MKLSNPFKRNDPGRALQIKSRYKSGFALMKNDRLDEAAVQFQYILSLQPNHTLAHYHLGEICHKQQDFEQALTHFREALKTNRGEINPADIHIALATTLFPLGQLEQTIQEFEKAIAISPERRDLHLNIGELHFQLGHYDEAINYFLKTDPPDPTARMYLAKAYWFKEEHEKSLDILREASKNFPASPEIYAYLGYLLLEKKVYKEAIDFLSKALELSKKPNEEIFINLGSAYYKSGNLEKALEIYNQATELFHDNTFFYQQIGFIYKDQNNLEAALRTWRSMVALDSESPEPHATLAFGLRLSGDFEAALEEAKKAISLDPTYPPAYTSKGNILIDMGNPKSAISSFEKAVDLGDEWALLDLAEVYQDLDNVEKAVYYAHAFIKAARKSSELETGLEDAKAILNTSRDSK